MLVAFVVWIVIVLLPMWLVVMGIKRIGRDRGWGLRQYVMGVVGFVPLWSAVILRYAVKAEPELTLRLTVLSFLLATTYGLGLLGWEQFFKQRAARRRGK